MKPKFFLSPPPFNLRLFICILPLPEGQAGETHQVIFPLAIGYVCSVTCPITFISEFCRNVLFHQSVFSSGCKSRFFESVVLRHKVRCTRDKTVGT